jgi:hypothetical protein
VVLTDAGILAALGGQTALQRVKLCRAPPKRSYDLPAQEYDYECGGYYDVVDEYDAPCAPSPYSNEARARGPTQLTADGIAAELRASAPLEQLSVDGFQQRLDVFYQIPAAWRRRRPAHSAVARPRQRRCATGCRAVWL